MDALYAVVFANRCRSNHHRLAVDALRHLHAPEAGRWRTMLLRYHAEYLGGAKAPDELFKDFKNHVLHVREGEWGGAIESCEEWYRRTVRALREKDWPQAAWCAGVMSHYFVDPLQPFHTHQTEEENIIHRAVEWSFSKSYGTFQEILTRDLGGYPKIEVPEAADWLAQMVRDGARAANAHYETIIDHYDFKRGVKDPQAGLDQELKDTVAKLVGRAVIGLSRVLDRAIAEAAVAPPRIDGALQTVLLGLGTPIDMILKAIDDAHARREVEAQYAEYRRTGKVRATLGEDDRVVRALHAEEVLKTPLSSLDCKWPRQIGSKARTGAPARGVKKRKAKSGRRRKAVAAPVLVAKAVIAPSASPPPTSAPTPVSVKLAAAPAVAEARPAPKPRKTPAAKIPRELPAGAPLARRDKTLPACTLSEDAPVVQAPAIGPKTAQRLHGIGVRTVADLLRLDPDRAQADIGVRHITAQTVRDWQAQARLACTVPGLKSREAQALAACGVTDARDLASQDAESLCEAIGEWGISDAGQRAWGNAPAPTVDDVATWMLRARRALPPENEASSVRRETVAA
jgi:hypothetical protein